MAEKKLDEMTKEEANKTLAEKGMKAAKVYLENKGYEVLDSDYKCPYGTIDVISRFEDTLAFTSVAVYRNDQNKLPKERINADMRQKMEQTMAHYLANHDYVDMNVRWDNMSILVLTDDRALLRYHVNALGGEGVGALDAIDEPKKQLKVTKKKEIAPNKERGRGKERVLNNNSKVQGQNRDKQTLDNPTRK